MGLISYDITGQFIQSTGVIYLNGPESFANTSQDFLIDAVYEIDGDGNPQLQDGYTEVAVQFGADSKAEITLQPTGGIRSVRMKTPGQLKDQRLAFMY